MEGERDKNDFLVKNWVLALAMKALRSSSRNAGCEHKLNLEKSLALGHEFSTLLTCAENLLSHGTCSELGLHIGKVLKALTDFFYTYFKEVHRLTINQITLYFERVSPSKMIYESIEPSMIAKDNEDIIFEAGIKYDV